MKKILLLSKITLTLLAVACFVTSGMSQKGSSAAFESSVDKTSKKQIKNFKEYSFKFENVKSDKVMLVPEDKNAEPIVLTKTSQGFVAKGAQATKITEYLKNGEELTVVEGSNIQARHRKPQLAGDSNAKISAENVTAKGLKASIEPTSPTSGDVKSSESKRNAKGNRDYRQKSTYKKAKRQTRSDD